jgi:DNA-binding NtrC family response regulator
MKNGNKILLIEDDVSYAKSIIRNLTNGGFRMTHSTSVEDAVPLLANGLYNLVLTDIRLPGASGLEFLDQLARMSETGEIDPIPPVIVLTSVSSVATAVEAMQKGAADYLTKEASRDEIILRLDRVLEQHELVDENTRLKKSLDRFDEFQEIIGVSETITNLKEQIREIGPKDVPVLIQGETGVGKELVARALVKASPRSSGAFIEVNCAALPEENLFLSELFGHEKGAFTGAIQRKRGQFELADNGTLFLDEVGELGPLAQSRLLKAVESLEFTRLGAEKSMRVNCRLVFATNRNIAEEVRTGRFREDLYYRMNIFPIHVPPLRARTDDIPPLVRFFAARFAEKHSLRMPMFGDDTMNALKQNPWPGNIRELRNVVERLAIRFPDKPVTPSVLKDLNLVDQQRTGSSIVLPEGGISLEDVEINLVLQALQRTDWNQRKAADLLGISVDRMNARVKKFGLKHPSWRVHKS